ncbi:MAG: ribosomal protein S18-alanine N-acetyltransferase [Zoogloeaceae bacterium]|jgi:ribosomal-protein-alanine N-acetyltransferase|nr:ribosomal protein S18-alanine N-acetyltransferase [Zoogloeaceae bacterium]
MQTLALETSTEPGSCALWQEGAGLELLPMQASDLAAVAALEALAQAFPWRERHFADALEAGYPAWILGQGGNLLGFLVLMLALDEAHLLNVAVAPRHQGKGLGARLLRHGIVWSAAQGAKKLYLEVRPSNQKALALYRCLGFVEIGRRKGYYPANSGREDGLVLCRALERES